MEYSVMFEFICMLYNDWIGVILLPITPNTYISFSFHENIQTPLFELAWHSLHNIVNHSHPAGKRYMSMCPNTTVNWFMLFQEFNGQQNASEIKKKL